MEPSAVEQLQAEVRQLRPEIEAMRARILRLEETQGATQTRDRARGQPSADSQPIAEDFRVLDRDRSSPLPPLKFTQPARPSLESRIGSQLFNRIGIVALLVGAAWSLKYAADRHWLGAEARVSIGFAVGLALLAWSERFRRQQFPVFSFSLKAVGTGVLYLVLWASFALFHLVPYPVAFAGMILVTAGNAWMCWVQRSEVLAAYAAIGGFLTPALLAQDHTSVLTLGSYLLLLNAGLLALLALRQWPRLLPAAFLGTTFYLMDLALHTARMHALGEAGEAFWLSAGFFALFSLAPVLLPSMDTSVAIPTAVSVTLANAAIGSFEIWRLGQGVLPAPQWFPVAIALWFAGILFAAILLAGRQADFPGFKTRSAYALLAPWSGLILLFTACGIWTALSGAGVILGWTLESACVLLLAARPGAGETGSLTIFQPVAPAALLAAAAFALLFDSFCHVLPPASQPILNIRFALYLLVIAVAVLAVRVAALQHVLHRSGLHAWSSMGAAASVLAVLLLLVCGGLEIHTWLGPASGQGTAERFWDSAWATMLGVALLGLGFRLRWALLRWQALALLTLAIAKVFLVDTRSLSQGLRIVSFLGLGVFLLGVSFIYQRDLLNLRGKEHGG
jgi:uncharacterized membrane protein